ncbi:hypothetical protein KC345_g6727 [Hortaea werneckii]|nr:hypothetical protein KC345_g6727 [Hortaea werneckii]
MRPSCGNVVKSSTQVHILFLSSSQSRPSQRELVLSIQYPIHFGQHAIVENSNSSLTSTAFHSPRRLIENNHLVILLLRSFGLQVTIIPQAVSPQAFPIRMTLPKPIAQSMPFVNITFGFDSSLFLLNELIEMLDRSIDVLSLPVEELEIGVPSHDSQQRLGESFTGWPGLPLL